MKAFTVHLSDDSATKLDRIAEKIDRSRTYVAAQAIESFIQREEWQLAEIEAGLAEAINADFASQSKVDNVFNKYVQVKIADKSPSPQEM